MAISRWTGNALPRAQVDTITVALTWATSDTATMTINGKDLIVTVGSSATTADVATLIKEAWNGDDFTDSTASSNTTGNLIGEFKDITATVSGSVVTLTGVSEFNVDEQKAGRPFTLTVTESTAGTGTATEATATTATGPHHFNDADNWSDGVVPGAADTAVFDHGNISCKYALDTPSGTFTELIRTMEYNGDIGLPEINTDDETLPYEEYLETYLTLNVTTISIGGGEGTGAGRTKIDSGSVTSTVNVTNTGQRIETGVPSLLWKGTNASNVVNLTRGDMGIAFYDDETSQLVATLRLGFIANRDNDARLICGSGVTITNIDQEGGEATIDSATTTIDQTGGALTIKSGAHADIDIVNGTVNYNSTGTITTLSVSNGVLDKTGNIEAATITNVVNLYKGASLLDPFGAFTLSAGYKINKARATDVTVDVGPDRTFTIA